MLVIWLCDAWLSLLQMLRYSVHYIFRIKATFSSSSLSVFSKLEAWGPAKNILSSGIPAFPLLDLIINQLCSTASCLLIAKKHFLIQTADAK